MKKKFLFGMAVLSMLPFLKCVAEQYQISFTGLVSSISDKSIVCESKNGDEVSFCISDSASVKEGYIPQISDLVYIRYREDSKVEPVADYLAPVLCLGSPTVVEANIIQMSSVIGPLVVTLPDGIDGNQLISHRFYFTAQSEPEEGQPYRAFVKPNSDISFVLAYHGTVVSTNENSFSIKPYLFCGNDDADVYVEIVDDITINVLYDKDTQYARMPQIGDGVEVYFDEAIASDEVYAIVFVLKMV